MRMNTNDSLKVGERIRKLREESEMTQEKLGSFFLKKSKKESSKKEVLGKQAVSAWEKGRNQVNAEQIIELCNLFKINPDYLLLGLPDEIGNGRKTMFLEKEEREIIEAYRNSTENGKKIIVSAANGAKEMSDAISQSSITRIR